MIWQLKNKYEWHKFYLIWPRIIENKLIWLESAERKWDQETNIILDQSAYGYAAGGWKYRINNKGNN